MKLALILSVVALVAGQPLYYPQPALPVLGACQLVSRGERYQCCYPEIFGGCAVAPGTFFPPGAPVPPGFRPPPQYLPPPQFLNAVCCPESSECCPVQQGSFLPQFNCCSGSNTCTLDDTGAGACNNATANGTTIMADMLDGEGRCPDGELPLTDGPGISYKCTLNKFLPNSNVCPPNFSCVKDRSDNINAGVCCRDNNCTNYTDCVSCASATPDVPPFGCSWLTQGDLYDVMPKCVATCTNFPDQSCIVGGLPLTEAQRRCPRTDMNPNGTNYNTGTCLRRCNLVGTGRSSRINNGTGNYTSMDTMTPCCMDFPGDFCCSPYGTLASHCAFGRVVGGPICGVPIRGSPNRIPSGPNGGYFPFPPNPFFPFREEVEEAYAEVGAEVDSWVVDEIELQEELEAKQFFYPPPPFGGPGGYPQPGYPGGYPGYRPPPPPPRYQPPPIDQEPSPYVCSCDSQCNYYKDCCDDYPTYCCADNTTFC